MQIYANNVFATFFLHGQIADSQQIFSRTAAILAATGGITSPFVPGPPEFVHGTHQAYVMDRQIASSSDIFEATIYLPSAVGLGTGRDFTMTQDEMPPQAFSSINANTALLTGAAIQNPLNRPSIQTFPQYPQDQVWSVVVTPPPVTAPPGQVPPIRPIRTFGVPQEAQDQLSSQFFYVDATLLPTAPKVLTSCGTLDFYDYGNGSVMVAWGPFGGGIPDSYNVYVNEVLVTNVTQREAIIPNLVQYEYQRQAVAPNPGNSLRPQSMPPVGVVTPAQTYRVRVVAVSAGVEVSPSDYGIITDQPTSEMLTTPMKRIFPFPNTGLN